MTPDSFQTAPHTLCRPANRTALLLAWRKKIAARQPIIGGYLGPLADAGAAPPDLFALYHTALFPEHGLIGGLLPFGDANRIVMELAGGALATAKNTPVLAGVSAADPFRLRQIFLKEIKAAGFAGIQNFPSMGVMDGPFRSHLESSGEGYNQEVELIRLGHQLDLLTAPLVFNPDEAARMTEAGADILVVNSPLRVSGFLSRENGTEREEILTGLRGIIDAAKSIRGDVILLYGSYCPADLAAASSLYKACPGFDGYWTIKRQMPEQPGR